jgi:hypothetical protein
MIRDDGLKLNDYLEIEMKLEGRISLRISLIKEVIKISKVYFEYLTNGVQSNRN